MFSALFRTRLYNFYRKIRINPSFDSIEVMKIYFIISLALILTQLCARHLLMIETITRHGVRYPQFPNAYDHSNITLLDNALKQLTVEGRHMHYLLGVFIYNKYWGDLFGQTKQGQRLTRGSIYAKSTDTNRTIESLEYLLAGFLASVEIENGALRNNSTFFPPFQGGNGTALNLDHSLAWRYQRFAPIHVEKGMEGQLGVANQENEGDFLAKQEHNLCSNQKKWEQQALNSKLVATIMQEPGIIEAVAKLQPFFPNIPLTFANVYKYVDNYMCLKAMGKHFLPIFQDPEIKPYLDYLYIARLYVVFLSTEVQVKTFSKTLLQNTLTNMRNAVDQKGPRMVFYSGHDSTIAILLAALNFTSIDCISQKYLRNITTEHCYWQYPPFASSFVFQLWEEANHTRNIEISINGKRYPIPICNYSYSCPLETFQRWFQDFTFKATPNEKCGVTSSSVFKTWQFWILLLLGTAVLLNLWFFCSRRKETHRRHRIFADQEVSIYEGRG